MGGGGSRADPVHDLVRLARRCSRGGRPAIEDGGTRQQLGDLAARARIGRHLGQRMATKAARGQITPADTPLSKIWFSEFNLEVTEAALALQGARSMATEGDELSDEDGRWQDAFLYARAYTIAGGSNEIMRNLIAERGLGLPREPRGPRVTSTFASHPQRPPAPHAARPGRGGGERPDSRRREGQTRAVEHPGAAAE